MALPDYSQYFSEDFNKGPIIDPKVDFRPRKAYYLNSQKDVANYLRTNTRERPKAQTNFDLSQKVELRFKEEYRSPQVQQIPEAEPVYKPTLQIQESINFKPYFWFLLACLTLIPLVNSTIHNLVNLTQNIGSTVDLSKERTKLTKDNQELVNKLQEYHSYSGMKRTIKEEIKVIEKNEILIKIVK